MRTWSIGLGVVVMVATGGVADAQSERVEINPTSTLYPERYRQPTSVGWYFTPTSTFFLTSLATRFSAVDATDPNRRVTAEVWSARPDEGGVLLGAAEFAPGSAFGTFGGATFSPILLQSSVRYFLGFRNVGGLGFNTTGDAGSLSLGPMWFSSGTDVTDDRYERMWEQGLRNPSLELSGDQISTAPEPVTMTLVATGLVALATVGYLRRRRAPTPSR